MDKSSIEIYMRSAALEFLARIQLTYRLLEAENRFREYGYPKVRNAKVKGSRFKSAMRSVLDHLSEGLMWMGWMNWMGPPPIWEWQDSPDEHSRETQS